MAKYTQDMCDRVIELGRLGYHHEEIASDLGVTRMTLHNWRNKHPAFDEAMEMCNTHSIAFWAGIPRRYVSGDVQAFNATSWIFTMKNKAGWVDATQQTIESKSDIELSIDEVVTQLQEIGVNIDSL